MRPSCSDIFHVRLALHSPSLRYGRACGTCGDEQGALRRPYPRPRYGKISRVRRVGSGREPRLREDGRLTNRGARRASTATGSRTANLELGQSRVVESQYHRARRG